MELSARSRYRGIVYTIVAIAGLLWLLGGSVNGAVAAGGTCRFLIMQTMGSSQTLRRSSAPVWRSARNW